jgi:hypothetical protein
LAHVEGEIKITKDFQEINDSQNDKERIYQRWQGVSGRKIELARHR